MIKIFLHITRIVVAAVTALLFASCTGINGSGKVVTENRKINGKFTKIEASSGLEVYITQGSVAKVVVDADDNLQQHIKTELSGNTLKIYTDKMINSHEATKVSVTTAVIEAIESSSGATVKGQTVFKNPEIDLDSSSGSNMEVAVETTKLDCSASSGSNLTVSGKTTDLSADSSSGSNLHTEKVRASNVKAKASSGSNIKVNPIESLDAKASSGSVVYYASTPAQLKKSTSSGGNVVQQ